ncbi:MAG: hypothetical protein VX944_04870 [Myxococcota bacterium]|nr:hypothetical protein [Myxococcota bacterium]
MKLAKVLDPLKAPVSVTVASDSPEPIDMPDGPAGFTSPVYTPAHSKAGAIPSPAPLSSPVSAPASASTTVTVRAWTSAGEPSSHGRA